MKLSNVLLKFFCACFILGSTSITAQELNFQVQVNTQNIAQPDRTIFKTLENSLQEFINNNKWTDQSIQDEERIDGALIFVVSKFENNRFQGNFQLSASRPVFNSTYTSTTYI